MQATLSELFRAIESEQGTHSFCVLVLEALHTALSQYKIKTRRAFRTQLMSLFTLVRETKPRYAILIESFYRILEVYDKQKRTSVPALLDEIERVKVSYLLEMKQLVQVSDKIKVEGKSILIHDHSHSVQNVLRAMREHKKPFQVIVAEQDPQKTHDNIAFLHAHDIQFKVVPAYMLSHIDKAVDMVFCGAVTFQQNRHLVMDPGSRSIISHFHLEKKPIYVFLSTSKFSLWQSTKGMADIDVKVHKRRHPRQMEIEFERLKFSHDRVAVDLVSNIVTEQGIYKPQGVVRVFNEKFKKRQRLVKKYFRG